MTVNDVTADLKPYPMEELTRLRKKIRDQGKTLFDFGTGDPKIPLWPQINECIRNSLPEISQYPSIAGTESLNEAHWNYLSRRFNLKKSDGLTVLPTRGSKEAVFHVALNLVGRLGRKKIIYPTPGYPVYESSTLFAGGEPYPVSLSPENGYRLEPWDLPEDVQDDCCAIWVNYPHNPTGATVGADYWKQLMSWAENKNVIVLSDDCYVDIFDVQNHASLERQPQIPLQFSKKHSISFFSLSKRSGFTGYRCGMMVGCDELMLPIRRSRANMGLGQPVFLQDAAALAWKDDQHVHERCEIFTKRMSILSPLFLEKGWLKEEPKATFYLWADITSEGKSDIELMREWAEQGIVVTPGTWLGSAKNNFVRLAMVPDETVTKQAMSIMKKLIQGK